MHISKCIEIEIRLKWFQFHFASLRFGCINNSFLIKQQTDQNGKEGEKKKFLWRFHSIWFCDYCSLIIIIVGKGENFVKRLHAADEFSHFCSSSVAIHHALSNWCSDGKKFTVMPQLLINNNQQERFHLFVCLFVCKRAHSALALVCTVICTPIIA